MASSESTKSSISGGRSLLSFLPNGPVRLLGEFIVSAIPGALLQFIFIVAAAGLNIWMSDPSRAAPTTANLYAAVYLPVACLLPLVVGAISALMLERIRGASSLHAKSGMITAALAGFVGALVGALTIISAGMLNSKPFGTGLDSTTYLIVLPLIMIIICTIMSAIGAALTTVIVARLEK